MEAVKAVFRSWENPRAIVYRRLNDIPGDWGTAVNVQEMVYEIWEMIRVRSCLYKEPGYGRKEALW